MSLNNLNNPSQTDDTSLNPEVNFNLTRFNLYLRQIFWKLSPEELVDLLWEVRTSNNKHQ